MELFQRLFLCVTILFQWFIRPTVFQVFPEEYDPSSDWYPESVNPYSQQIDLYAENEIYTDLQPDEYFENMPVEAPNIYAEGPAADDMKGAENPPDEGLIQYLQDVVETFQEGYVADAPYNAGSQPMTGAPPKYISPNHRPTTAQTYDGKPFTSRIEPVSSYYEAEGYHFFEYPQIAYDSSTYATCDGGFYVRCIDSKFRSIDGSCNNLLYPTWGKANTCIPRLLGPAYADGYSAPRISVTGAPLPSPRTITNYLHPDVTVDSYATGALMQWGQIIGHEVTKTPNAQSGNPKSFKCCPKPEHPECFPIPIPEDDYFFKYIDKKCMKFVRSKPCNLCKTYYREQVNDITSYIDGSLVYGSSQNESLSLREFKGGRMLISVSSYGAPLLPYSTSPFTDSCSEPEKNHFCYRAGDSRANQHPALLALHTIILRQHNRIAYALESINPYWSDQRLYQETRRIIGAQMQAITYKEFLPFYIGADYMNFFGLNLQSYGYTTYKEYLLGAIFTEFSAAAFRSGHTLIYGNMIEVMPQGEDKFIKLRDFFFYPFDMVEGQLDPILKGLLRSACQSYDPYFTVDIKNHLAQKRGSPSGGDLPSINIQRGRDHGIPGYTAYLKLCFNKTIYSFEELDQFMPPEQRIKYQHIYSSVDDIDLFSGGISERSLPGSITGPTFACIIGLQFHHLKYGDRYYFEHGYQTGSFTEDQLKSLRETTLSKLICANGDYIPYIQKNAFLPESMTNPVVNCDEIPDVDLTLWKDGSY